MKYILLINIFLYTGLLYAQTGVIKGRAIGMDTRDGVPFANVALLSSTDSTVIKGEITDSTGRFEFSDIIKGTYILEVSAVGYSKVSKGPFILDSLNTVIDLINLSMVVDEQLLKEVIIKGEKPAFERQFDKTIINVSSNSLFKTSINAIDVLNKSPGIKVGAEGDITIRNNISPVVLIDGKPVPMSRGELSNYLNSLTTSQIESIEVIENPSARYDGEYKGIINIKLKRDKNLGWNGNISGYGSRNSLNSNGAGITANYKTRKLSYFGTYWFNDNQYYYKNRGVQLMQNGTEKLNSQLSIPRKKKTHSYQLGAEYNLTKKQTLGILYKGFNAFGNNTSVNLSQLIDIETNTDKNSVLTRNIQKPLNNEQSINASYRGEFVGQQLGIDASYADYNSSQNQDISNYVENILDGRLRNNTDSRVKIKSAQFDYMFRVGRGKAETGAKIAETHSYNNLMFDTLSKDGSWVDDIRRSNEFNYDETILAAYLSYSKSFGKKINMQVGVRWENTKTHGDSRSNNQVIKREYFKLLPNIKLGYQINENSLLSIGYSRRISRPSFYSLNPFRLYLSPYMYTEGNPFILPTINNTSSISYSFRDINTSISYRKDINIESQVPLLDSTTNITLYTRGNFGNRDMVSYDINYPIIISKWWKMQNYFGLYYLRQDIPYVQTTEKVRQLSFSLNGSSVFTLKKDWTLELSYGYNSKSKGFIYNVGNTYQVKAALQKSFFQNKLNTQLVLYDIFFSSNPKLSANVENFKIDFYQTYDTRMLKIQLTYKFGESSFQQKDKKSSGAEEENRAKN